MDEPRSRSLLKIACALSAAGAVIAFAIGVIAGMGSVGLAGESCKHGDCGAHSSAVPMIVAGVLAGVFAVMLLLVITGRKR